jgi:hypothetical protein
MTSKAAFGSYLGVTRVGLVAAPPRDAKAGDAARYQADNSKRAATPCDRSAAQSRIAPRHHHRRPRGPWNRRHGPATLPSTSTRDALGGPCNCRGRDTLWVAIVAAIVLAAWNAFADAQREEAIRRQTRADNDAMINQILERIKQTNNAVIKGANEPVPSERTALIAVAIRFADQVTAYLSNQLTGMMARRLREPGPRPSAGYDGEVAVRSEHILQEVADETVDSFNRHFKPTAVDLTQRLASIS